MLNVLKLNVAALRVCHNELVVPSCTEVEHLTYYPKIDRSNPSPGAGRGKMGGGRYWPTQDAQLAAISKFEGSNPSPPPTISKKEKSKTRKY